MKKLIFGLFLFGFIAAGNSQILLEETRIEYQPVSMKLDPDSHQLTIELNEKVMGEFQQDPLAFMKAKFDARKFAEINKEAGYSAFEVHFKSRKGYLQALFNKSGDLISSNQKFKNVRLPEDVRLEILRLHKDAMVKDTKYTAYSKGWDINKEVYKVKINDGDRTRRIRINRDENRLSIAGF